jgi:hypothetical protein
MEDSQKVNNTDNTVIDGGGDGQSANGGDNQGASVTDDTVNEEKTVPLSALKAIEAKYKAEKDARAEAERSAYETAARMEAYEKYAAQQTQTEDDEYEPITKGELKKVLAEYSAETSAESRNKFIRTSAEFAKNKYGAEVFDEAFHIFKNQVSPKEQEAILYSNNPGENMLKYVRAIHGFSYEAKKGSADNARDIASQITENTNQPKTLSDTSKTASKTLNKMKELQNKTPQEIGRMLDEKVRNKGG